MLMEVHVDCYAGYRGEEVPRRLRMGSLTIAIDEIIDQWLAPDHRYFKVRGDDAGIYILRHDPFASKWEITFFQRQP